MAEEKRDDDTIYVGKKPAMGYVLAALTQINNGAKEVVVKARGKLTAKAITVAEVLRNRYVPELKVKEVKIGTEELTSEDGKVSRVSAIEIILAKE